MVRKLDASLIAIPLCALAGRVHGGGPTPYREFVRKHIPKLDHYLDGDIASPILFAAICSFFMPWWFALGAGLGWWAGWAPDIGDRVSELRMGKWKLAVQRGIFLGSMIALGTWNPAFIISGAFFAPVYWLTRKGEWHLSEYAMGAILGVPLLLNSF